MRLVTKRRDMFTPGDRNNLATYITDVWAKRKPIKISSLTRKLDIKLRGEGAGIRVRQNGKMIRVQIKDAVFDQETGTVKQASWMWAK